MSLEKLFIYSNISVGFFFIQYMITDLFLLQCYSAILFATLHTFKSYQIKLKNTVCICNLIQYTIDSTEEITVIVQQELVIRLFCTNCETWCRCKLNITHGYVMIPMILLVLPI